MPIKKEGNNQEIKNSVFFDAKIVFSCVITIILTAFVSVFITNKNLNSYYKDYYSQTAVLEKELNEICISLKNIEKKYGEIPKEARSTMFFTKVLMYINEPGISLQEKILREWKTLATVTSHHGTMNRDCRFQAGDKEIFALGGSPKFIIQWAGSLEDNREIDVVGNMLAKDLASFFQQYEK